MEFLSHHQNEVSHTKPNSFTNVEKKNKEKLMLVMVLKHCITEDLNWTENELKNINGL